MQDLKVAPLLGEDVDNPKVTFRAIEGLLDDRISSLSKKLFEHVKEIDKEKLIYDNLDKEVNTDVDSIENEFFYIIKKHVENLHKDLDELDAYSLLLQKQITTLKKEKVDLILQINTMNTKMDDMEKDLGINISAKRAKKKI